MSDDKQGFASLPKDKHIEVSSKGGKAKVPKGWAKLTKEERSLNASNAAKERWRRVAEEIREIEENEA